MYILLFNALRKGGREVFLSRLDFLNLVYGVGIGGGGVDVGGVDGGGLSL